MLAELFEGRSQLVIYHAVFDPETAGPQTSWTQDSACFLCSYWIDNFDRVIVHLNHRPCALALAALAVIPGWSPLRSLITA